LQKEKDLHPLKPFDKEQFQYDKEHDCYICPASKRPQPKNRERTYRAKAQECQSCRFFGVCTKSRNGRVVIRLQEEAVKEKLEITYRSSLGQAVYKLRKQKVELPFGHFKRNLGAGHFLLKGRAGATAELSLLATCFNVTRMMTLLGIPNLLAKLAVKQAVLQPV